MLHGKTVAVVVPAYNEETQIEMVLDTMPDFVDRIIVVNDGSKDRTGEIVMNYIHQQCKNIIEIGLQKNIYEDTSYNHALKIADEIRKKEADFFPKHQIYNDNAIDRIVLINQENSKVGGAIATGYKWCREHRIDCTAVMAGDGQMDPAELESICTPVIIDEIDYVKGNRLIHKAASTMIPKKRFLGNSVLSILTKIASGYWSISDTQTGYTAISLSALDSIEIHKIYRDYGVPNDILVKLNIAYCSLREIPIKPVYNVGEQSKMKISRVIPTVSILLIKNFFCRLFLKYFLRDFHPLFLFYTVGMLLSLINIPFIISIIYNVIILNGSVTIGIYITFLLLTLFSFQSIAFGMWMDIQDNDRLFK